MTNPILRAALRSFGPSLVAVAMLQPEIARAQDAAAPESESLLLGAEDPQATARAVRLPRQATVVEASGGAEVILPARHALATGEVVPQRARVTTGPNGALLLQAEGRGRIRLLPGTTLVLFGNGQRRQPGRPAREDTTLVRGAVEISAPMTGDPAPATTTLETVAGTILLQRGRAFVRQTSLRSVHVAVLEGRVRVRVNNRDTIVREGNAVRLEFPRLPSTPRPLPSAPSFVSAPPESLLPQDEAGAVVRVQAAQATGDTTRVARWHFRLERTDGAGQALADVQQPAGSSSYETPALQPGTYALRVAAVDVDGFESASSPPATFRVVAPTITPAQAGQRALVQVPQGLVCGLDGATRRPGPVSLGLQPGSPHTLACAASAAPDRVVTRTITALEAGPLTIDVRVQPDGFDPRGGMRVLTIRLSDATDALIGYANIRVTPSSGVWVSPIQESDRTGYYVANIRWNAGVPDVRLDVDVNDGSARTQYVLGPRPALP